MTNTPILLTAPILALLEGLLSLLRTSNLLDGPFALQSRTYGAISSALRTAMIDALHTTPHLLLSDCDAVADTLLDAVLHNGEDIAYNLDLWNRNIIS